MLLAALVAAGGTAFVSPAFGHLAEDSFSACWLPVEARSLTRPARPEGLVHHLAPGETLWELARRYRVRLGQLIACNGIKDPTRLPVGLAVFVPGARLPARNAGGSLSWPLLGVITSFYGPRGEEFHHGLDIAGEEGAPVRAAGPGTVAFAGRLGVYGNAVIVDHGARRTLYGHLSGFAVAAGDVVERGEVLGYLGSSGRASGPHLHFEVREEGGAVNPLPYLGS